MARMRGMEFMRALSSLERRFGIKIPKRPEVDIDIPTDKSGHYESGAWADAPRVLSILEKKLGRLRHKVAMLDYVKWCRVLDAMQWDLDRGVNPVSMVPTLMKLKMLMDGAGQDADF
jgi:hypothetical protein